MTSIFPTDHKTYQGGSCKDPVSEVVAGENGVVHITPIAQKGLRKYMNI